MASYILAITLFAMFALTIESGAARDQFLCHYCWDCPEVHDNSTSKTSCELPNKCFIVHDNEKQIWSRGCGPAILCDDVFEDDPSNGLVCYQCSGDDCNDKKYGEETEAPVNQLEFNVACKVQWRKSKVSGASLMGGFN